MANPTQQSDAAAIKPYNTGMLEVSDLHCVYYEECGNKDGKPVIFLHGGPGGGCLPKDRSLFDPEAYRIVLMDQRGAGQSKPLAELKDNTTWHLVADIEKLREHLGIEKWVVFGGSWGSTLSLAYAQKHPDRVKAIVLRGVFTLRRKELEWFYQGGASFLFPDHWEEYVAPIPPAERGDLMSAYYRRLTGDDKEEQLRCARAWSKWELSALKLTSDPAFVENCLVNLDWALAFASIECHYFVHGGWLESDTHLLDNIDLIRHIPCTIVQGRYDVITPMTTAWELHKRWPEAEFQIAPTSGHSAYEPEIEALLLKATNKYKHL